jgi:hypothetical protein
VVLAALGVHPRSTDVPNLRGAAIPISLAGVAEQPTVWAQLSAALYDGPENDLAILTIANQPRLAIAPVEFASPLRHGGKSYSVMGFPGGDPQGRNASGRLHPADAKGLVQMDRGGALSVLGGFSGAPVWSSDLNAFVGIVVTELAKNDVSWCIPSRRICQFYPDLRVRFRIPPSDRPTIHDYTEDDPNVDLFGTVSRNSGRTLTATIVEHDEYYSVSATYECTGLAPRGQFVTFITYPDFTQESQDAYELFSRCEPVDRTSWRATTEFEPEDLFTLAAVGDAGDTVLTLDLKGVPKTLKPSKRTISNRSKRES